jgi:hypothetical protein
MNRFPASKIWPGLRRQEQPKVEEPKVSPFKIGEKYQWKHTGEPTIVYTGKNGLWHQFDREDKPGRCWCEVLDEHTHLIIPVTERP